MIVFLIFVSFIKVICNGQLQPPNTSTDPEVKMNVTEIITYYKYPCENHQVTTEDGYILSLQRIPFGLKNSSTTQRPVVFLQHGLSDSSFTWVANGPEKSLGFVLADNGFDVWLSNTRGNVYSNSHIKYTTSSKYYWDFTWDDMVKYDLPATINYVLSVTKAQKLGYIGHSQGTEIAFARFSQNTDLNSKVSSFVALAPVVYLGHLKTVIKYLSGLAGGISSIANLFGTGEFLPNNELVTAMSTFICGDKMISTLCGHLMFQLYGPGSENMNYTRIPIYLSHFPAGTSWKNIVHYAQSHLTNEFQMYDYGFFGNLVKYSQAFPPKYKLNTNGLPIAAIWAGADWLSAPEDVLRALTELGDNVKFKKFIPEYNHIDVIWGTKADVDVFPDVVNFLNQFGG